MYLFIYLFIYYLLHQFQNKNKLETLLLVKV